MHVKELVLTNIQRFSIGDGPGIRTTVFFKGCNLHCPWCHNPETISPEINELYGEKYTVDEVMKEIMEDYAFYQESGGGVTLSGGEPLLQADGCAELARACTDAGISVLLDTAGNVDFSLFEKVLPYVEKCYFDLKSGTEDGYRVVGGQLHRTLNNMKKVIEWGVPTVARVPVIPGFNDSIESAEYMVRGLSGIAVKRVDLLPFHRMGSSKYTKLGLTYQYKDIPPLTSEHLEPLIRCFQENGFVAAME